MTTLFQDIPIRIIIAGRSKSGKTTLLINLLMKSELLCSKFDKITIISPTAYTQDKLWNNLKKPDGKTIVLHNKYQETIIDEVEKKPLGEQHLVVFDDCLGQLRAGASYRNKLDQLMARARHNNISVIINTQSIMALTPSIRQDSDVYIVFEQHREAEVERLKEEFYYFSKEDFKKLLKYCTKDQYSFLIINKAKPVEFYRCFNKLEISFPEFS